MAIFLIIDLNLIDQIIDQLNQIIFNSYNISYSICKKN